MPWNSTNKTTKWVSVTCLVLGFIRILFISLQSEYVNGWDGYYYVMQVHSWFTYGHLQSLDYSLIYPYFGMVHILIPDYEIGHKIGTAIIGGFLLMTSYLLTKSITPRLISILTPMFLLFSPTITYFILQFPKNALGAIFLVLAIRFILNKNLFWAVLLIVLSLLTHRLTGMLGLVLIGLMLIRQINWKWLILVAIPVLLLSLLPGILHISDFERFLGQFSYSPQFSPFSFSQILNIDVVWKLEIIVLSISILITLFQFLLVGRSFGLKRLLFLIYIAILLFPFLSFETGSIGFRLFLLAPIFLMILLVTEIEIPQKIISLSVCLLLIMSMFSANSYKSSLDPPNQQFELISERLEANFSSEEYTMVIVHKSLAEMIIFKTDFDALNWSPPSDIDQSSILRISSGLQYFEFQKYLGMQELGTIKKLTLGYYAVPELVWTKFLQRIKSANDLSLIKKIAEEGNPIENRPLYLTRGKPNKWKN